MPAKKQPAAKRIAARKQKKTNKKPAAKQKKQQLKTKLEDWADKQVILTALDIKDGSLKNMRRRNIIAYSKLTGKYYYYKPSFVKLLEANMKGTL